MKLDLSPGAPRGYWFEDFEIGMVMESPGRTITEADILNFAGLTGDFTPIHLDDTFARASIYGERIAHGLMGLVFAQGLISLSAHLWDAGVASLSWKNWEFKEPLRLGDTVRARWTLTDKRESRSRPGLGIITEFVELVNQHGSTVQHGDHVTLVKKRAA
ncbi:dehydratase [Oleomonas cavernae]|uniref:Dehydratase n=1 Tax=Oleomonas cavernae TaxID=2320859 RepID=A0A418W8J7_9PROT|nr:MaoC/PaaZ C-terminal domain-containing protein [Oleomonas cavernae]RJF86325.1 dehydratase [Oleomonas cavernae]